MSSDRENGSPPDFTGWERKLVEELARESLKEQRKARRWGLFFKLFTVGYLVLLLILWAPGGAYNPKLPADEYAALVEVKGVIAADTEASADKIIAGIRDAYEDDKVKGIILRINSPGGSPVQAGMVYDEIRRLRKEHADIPVYAVVMDVCASGGYYIAAAADKIYVDKASIVGSIGVLMNGFGFTGTMDKLGVERRLLTAGEHKGIMDPFSPLSEFDRDHIKGLLEQMHQQFISVVREGRGDRLKGDDQLFSGLFWSGEEGIELGLADALGSSSQVARDVIGAEEIVDFTHKEDLVERLAKRFGAGATSALLDTFGMPGLR